MVWSIAGRRRPVRTFGKTRSSSASARASDHSMYTDYYRFSGLPFQLTPDARFFFASSGHSKAMAHLTYGLGQGEGFIIITGDIGAGKTTVVENLLRQLDGRKYVAATITNTQLGADDMLRMV